MSEEWRPAEAVDYRELFDRPLSTLDGHDGPVLVLSERERHDIAYSLMVLTHRVEQFESHRNLRQIMEDQREGDALGRIVVDMAADMTDLGEATIAIVGELVRRLGHEKAPHLAHNFEVLKDAQRQLKRDPLTTH